MRWFVKGDIHGDLSDIYDFINRFGLGEGDNIIILGDTGLFWYQDLEYARQDIDLYEEKCNGVHLYWLDGNHENFDIIKTWNCNGNIYNNSEHIHYCSRGSVLEMEINGQNKKALIMGGADSVDRFRRREHYTWWEDEKITDEDVDKVKEGYYDYVFTHCCPYSEVQKAKVWLFTLSNITDSNIIHYCEKQLDKVFNKITFGHHYFGHYHINKEINEKHTCLYRDFIELK